MGGGGGGLPKRVLSFLEAEIKVSLVVNLIKYGFPARKCRYLIQLLRVDVACIAYPEPRICKLLRSPAIDSLESISWLLKRLQIRALVLLLSAIEWNGIHDLATEYTQSGNGHFLAYIPQ